MITICKPYTYPQGSLTRGTRPFDCFKVTISCSKIKEEDKERNEQLLNRAASRVSAREQKVRTKNCIHIKFS